MAEIEKTLIRGPQIKIEDFIKTIAGNNVNWNNDEHTASMAAIAAKIQSEIAGVAGAMLYRGAWTHAANADASAGPNGGNAIKKGYVYVYNGHAETTIGTGGTAVTLEPGDTLIANRDAAAIDNPSHWTIVNVNITGALTKANFIDWLVLNYIAPTNTEKNIVDVTEDGTTGKLKLTYTFPTINNGTSESGKYISAISINPSTGAITVTKGTLPTLKDVVLHAACSGHANGDNVTFKTPSKAIPDGAAAFYINGVMQTLNTDYTYDLDGDGLGVFTITGGYVPQEGDLVTCSYIKG